MAAAELYDPVTGEFTPTGSLIAANDGGTTTRLSDGRVLVAGGAVLNGDQKNTLASAELYDPQSGLFAQCGSMAVGRWQATATLLPDGRILITGGWSIPGTDRGTLLDSTEIFDPDSRQFSPGPKLSHARRLQAAVLLSDGSVLIFGGSSETVPGDREAEIFRS